MNIPVIALIHIAVIVIFSAGTLAVAGSFAITPLEKRLALVKPCTIATTFAILNSIVSGLCTTFKNVADLSQTEEDSFVLLMGGLSEALVLAMFGFTLLTLAWMCVAIGIRRLN